jgi:hypothetical protein
VYRKRISHVVAGLVLSTLLMATAQADISAGLVGYWPLDGDAVDASGHGFDGTVGKVTPAPDRLGYADSAMSFTGATDSVITIGDPAELQITGEITVAAWVFLNAGNKNNCRIIAKSGGSGNRSWSLNIEANSGGVTYPPTFQIGINGGASNISVRGPKPLPTDEWAHMTGIYRPGEATEVYVNGELQGTNKTSIPATQHSKNNLAVLIGNRHAASDCGWNGLIDEARIYARALAASDVAELVQFHPAPRLKAWNPNPADGAEGVDSPLLGWKAGVTGVLHKVYVGADPNLTETNLVAPASPLLMQWYGPGLEPGRTYYWRVDEIEADNATVHTGDVWSFTALPLTAYHPEPADAANGVATAPTLTWRAGMAAIDHHVYFGDDLQAVAQGAAAADQGTTKEMTFTPEPLEEARVYYWRVDETAAGGAVNPGAVWSFATFRALDDFESYTDQADEEVFSTWLDGYLDQSSGSMVGHLDSANGTFCETTIVHNGRQSMPLEYNNVNTPFYSEAERTWDTQQNWTADGVDTFVLYVRGRTGNTPDTLYVTVKDSTGHQGTAIYPDAAVFTAAAWTEWQIPLTTFSDAGVNLTRVKMLILGVGNRANPAQGGAGLIYVDDIRLLRPAQP